MPTAMERPVAERLLQVLQHLGLTRVHVAARLGSDWSGLATTHPEVIASLTLVCPTGMETHVLRPLAPRLLVCTGDQGEPAEAVQRAMMTLPEATLVTLRDYFGHPRADVLTDRTQEMTTSLLAFLARIDQEQALRAVPVPAGEGEVADIAYRAQGAGPSLLLLPLGLAPSQWEPLLPSLSQRYCRCRSAFWRP